ncbi:hypothetical protein OX284_006755 [Flavobacterium sp. SUN046]|uniref:hypothetical protein n=1 Tax=Flavobacterium sp. SUN046 TaxID=3002440 RepID=UPI002DB60D2E|nr:hypothetical protein [Flavobacterium sp. SUN046]MEC4049123.1 hypothetical protein [Flavobacterium sp. SUN046]
MKIKLLIILLLIGIFVKGQVKNDSVNVIKEIKDIKNEVSTINKSMMDFKSELESKINEKDKTIEKLKKQKSKDSLEINKYKFVRNEQLNSYIESLDSINSINKQINDLKKSLLKEKDDVSTKIVDKLNTLINNKKKHLDIKKDLESKDSSLKNTTEAEKASDYLSYLNAYNFDFNSTDKTSGYLGNLNLFFNIKNSKATKWYINTGLKKIDYSFSNNNVTEDKIDNIKLNPLENINTVGNKYLTEYNRYTTSTKIKSWSGYFQLLHKITKIKNLYLHAHTEFQISKAIFKTSIQTLDTITNTITNSAPTPTIYNTLDNEYEIDKTYFGYYLGVGTTGDFLIVDNSDFKLRYFVQFSTGFSNIQEGNSRSINAFQEVKNNYSDFTPNFDSNKHFFHLLNTYVSNKINNLNLIIGTEIRGNYLSPPLYIFYVGINSDLDKIANLFQ